jgi:hypothetical protein
VDNLSGIARVALDTLAEDLSKSKRSIQRVMKSLEQKGLVTNRHHFAAGGKGPQLSNSYELKADVLVSFLREERKNRHSKPSRGADGEGTPPSHPGEPPPAAPPVETTAPSPPVL